MIDSGFAREEGRVLWGIHNPVVLLFVGNGVGGGSFGLGEVGTDDVLRLNWRG